VGDPDRDALVDELIQRLRRRVCIFIGFAGVFFAVFVIQTQATAVGVVGGISAVAGSGFAVASVVARERRHAVERTWLAVGLAAFSVVLVVLVNVF
jgi:hypothetical protein